MKRSTRKELAQQTVEIVERGSYQSATGRMVDIAASVRTCLEGTQFFPPEKLEELRQQILGSPPEFSATSFEVVNETTLAGITRLLADGSDPIAVLNFASAKNPGGGFLNGSQAQEESLARSSALYASQHQAWEFYDRHRNLSSLLYSDAMIWSPDCPIFRDDEGTLLDAPQLVNFITSPAPNAGATADNRPQELVQIPDVSAGGRSMCWRWPRPRDAGDLSWARGGAASSVMTRPSWPLHLWTISEMEPGRAALNALYFQFLIRRVPAKL